MPPEVRVSRDAWAAALLAVGCWIVLHIWRPPDPGRAQETLRISAQAARLLILSYYLVWAGAFAGMGWLYYRIARTRISETALIFPSLSGERRLLWSEVIDAKVLKNASIVLRSPSKRAVVPVLFCADKEAISEFVLAKVRQAGAAIHDQRHGATG